MKNNHSIVYVNFSPYDNAGRILDFLIANFRVVIHFSYDHLRLKNGRNTNLLTVYEKGQMIQQRKLFPLRTPESLRFLSLPAVALLILWQTLFYIWQLKRRYEKLDSYLSVNAYTAWVGNLAKKLHLVARSIFWVWDYYPPGFADWRIRLLRWVYWRFDKPAAADTSSLAFISDKLAKLRKSKGVISPNRSYTIIPIGTNPTAAPFPRRRLIIGFLGMLKQSQGLDFLFDALPILTQRLPDVRIEIVGSGPEEEHFRRRGRRWERFVKLWGFIEREEEVDRIMRRWMAGLATYLPIASNESYWTDPSKIKAYLSQRVPVIMTDVPHFAREVVRAKAGVIINYGKPQELVAAILRIHQNWKRFALHAYQLAQRYDYQRRYQKFLRLRRR